MPKWLASARWVLLAAIVVFMAALFVSARVVTDWLWFKELGYEALLIRPIVWKLGVAAAGAVAAALFVAINLRVTGASSAETFRHWQERSPIQVAGEIWVRRAFGLLALIVGIGAGVYLADQWQVVAFALTGGRFGANDPLFARDIGFYLFKLPFFELLLPVTLGLVMLTILVVGAVYVAGGALSFSGWRPRFETKARVHLAALLALGALIIAAGYRLEMYRLVYSTRGAIFGAGYSDVYAVLPALWVQIAASLLLAVSFIVYAFRPVLRWVVTGFVLLVAASVIGQGIYPRLVQEFVVRPNELEKELPYIADHLEMTRLAFGLSNLIQRDYDPQGVLTVDDVAENAHTLANIRLWDYRPLLSTYAQLQELRPYYDFIEVDVDRYMIDGEYRQVMIAARELTSARLQNQSWVNVHLQYTHGYGVVMSPVNEADARGLPRFYLSDIPPRSSVNLTVSRPEIYYGEQEADYVVVKTRRAEFDYPLGDDNATTFYEGDGGVPLGGWLRRALFAARLGTTRLLLSKDITSESRIMLYRQIQTRLRTLAPFLRYDRDPYLVLSEGRLFWIADAYTSSSRFPYAAPVPGWGNYVRNPVKAVIDAYNGTVDFYIVEQEPIAAALSRIYPGVFKPISQMPEDLRRHLRYPEDIFRLQASVLTRYHMTNPQVFYNQEDVWELPKEVYERSEIEMEPYYVISRLPGEQKEEFLLLIPFTPLGKGNMVAWLAARNDGEAYGELVLYRFGKQDVTFGPMQFEARVNQDTDISRELTLWSQQGSRVIRGNLIIVPIGNTLLYVEPLFLQAEQGEIPELKQVIAGTGNDLVMRPTLREALAALAVEGPKEHAASSTPPAPSTGRSGPEQPVPGVRVDQEPEGDAEPSGIAPSAETVPRGEAAVDGTEAQLVRRARSLFDEARRFAGEGDWSAYGAALDELAGVLEQLEAIYEADR